MSAPFPYEGITNVLTEEELEQAVFETFPEFQASVASTLFSDDEVGYWACEQDGLKYQGPSVRTPRPHWATHVYWYGA